MKMINESQKRGYNRSLIEQEASLQERKSNFWEKKEKHCYNYPFIAQIQQNTPNKK